METRTIKRVRLEDEAKSRQQKVQWKYLPDDVWNFIFLTYCDCNSLVNSRVLQSKYVQEFTECKDMEIAIRSKSLKKMKWIYQYVEGFQWHSFHFNAAAQYSTLEVMKWMKTKNCPWTCWTFRGAAREGNLNKMKWLKENYCPWNHWTFAMAAASGNLVNLKWLKKNGCPWNFTTFRYAAGQCDGTNFEVLEWVRTNNFPWDAKTFMESCVHPTAVKWLTHHSMTTFK